MNRIRVNCMYRVQKSEAKMLYDAGLPVTLCPSKMRPHDRYYNMSADIDNGDGESFEKKLMYFEAYNCTLTENGLERRCCLQRA